MVTLVPTLTTADGGTSFRVEVNGQVFIGQRRAAMRSLWYVTISGMVAEPDDRGRRATLHC